MRKHFYLSAAIALGAFALTSCSSEEFLGQNAAQPDARHAILFQTAQQNVGRATATGADAAALLDHHFRVYGVMTKDGADTIPFDNYTLAYNGKVGDDDTNTAGWTYLSDTDGSALYSKGAAPALQEIRFWDKSATHYNFVAFAGLDDSKSLVSDQVNTIDVDATNQDKIFFADRVTANPGTIVDGKAPNVLFTFRHLTSKMRVGLYETVPGYAVKNVRFYFGDNYFANAGTSTKTELGLQGKFPVSGQYTVSYGADNNALVAFDGASTQRTLTFGALDYTTAPSSLLSGGNLNGDGTASPAGEAVFLGQSAAATTFAKVDGEAWQTLLPYPENDRCLILRADFDLVPNDASEAITTVKGATAVVPLEYCQWQPNTAYTYIFKITSTTNGTTGDDPQPPVDPDDPQPPVDPDPGALYPITFDAAVSSIQDFTQETITAVADAAITTYVEGSAVVNNDEYRVGDDITVSSATRQGRWSVAYSSTLLTEQEAAVKTLSYTVLAGDATADKTIAQNAVAKTHFKADAAGWYVVCLRYLPIGLDDTAANYTNAYKVVKVK